MTETALLQTIQPQRQQLLEHPLYHHLTGAEEVRLFLRHHVFCVWDFMSLLKSLQRRLTCVEVPWLPSADPVSCRLINEIVLGEESDEDGQGGHLSHFALYLSAMRDAGADTGPIDTFLQALRAGQSLETGLRLAQVPPRTAAFVRTSLQLAQDASLARVAAAFTYGREDVIPDLFIRVLRELGDADPCQFGRLRFYLERHITLDGDEHGHAARHLVARVCGNRETAWREAVEAAQLSLQARSAVWDEILDTLRGRG